MTKKRAHLKRRTAATASARTRKVVRAAVKKLAKAGTLITCVVPQLRADEDYRGVLLDPKTNKPVAHLVEHRKEIEGNHAELTAMAASLGADYQLFDRQEAALCFANGKAAHQQRYYWTREGYPGHSDYACVQNFGGGIQGNGHKASRYVGRAVRRVAI